MILTDLETAAAEVNAKLAAAGAPIYVSAGKRALKWWKRYEYSKAAYGISKGQAFNILFGYGAEIRGLAR